jgi:Zn-dependent protease
MGRSFHIGTYAGIPVKVHWSFGLMIIAFFFMGLSMNFDVARMLWFFGYILVLFLCVILHEYGHALTARRYDVSTRDIILSPIGGLARLEKIPEDPLHEFFIAIAGPLVNVAIAIAIFLVLLLSGHSIGLMDINYPNNSLEFFQLIFWLNIILFTFNLIPAFPMDGGRIVRSLLSIKLGREKATMVASTIGKGIALIFISASILQILAINNITIPGLASIQEYLLQYEGSLLILGMIGIFVFIMANGESSQVRLDAILKRTTLDQIANYKYTPLSVDDLMEKALTISELGRENSFLIFDKEEKVVGNLHHYHISDALQSKRMNESVSYHMSSKVFTLSQDASVRDAFLLMDKEALVVIPILDTEGKVVATLDRKHIKSFINTHSKTVREKLAG